MNDQKSTKNEVTEWRMKSMNDWNWGPIEWKQVWRQERNWKFDELPELMAKKEWNERMRIIN